MRASKYNPTTRAKLLMYIRDGRTVKDACSLVGISDMTLTRWRRRFPDFDADYLKADEEGKCPNGVQLSWTQTSCN